MTSDAFLYRMQQFELAIVEHPDLLEQVAAAEAVDLMAERLTAMVGVLKLGQWKVSE
jgi:hypothetical protein